MTKGSRIIRFLAIALLSIVGCISSTLSPISLEVFHGISRFSAQTIENEGNGFHESQSFPLTVNIDSDISTARISAIIAALEHWNREVDAQVFIWRVVDLERFIFYGFICQPQENEIFVFESELGRTVNDEILLGLTTNYYFVTNQNQIQSSTVQFDPDLELENVYTVALHEFGHVLGLSHDEDSWTSIMFPHALNSLGFVEDVDVAYVRSQFLP